MWTGTNELSELKFQLCPMHGQFTNVVKNQSVNSEYIRTALALLLDQGKFVHFHGLI